MKRNNLLMLSYIIFIFIALVVRWFWDFPLWPTLVVAIAVASALLTLAEFNQMYATEELALCDILIDGSAEAIHRGLKMVEGQVTFLNKYKDYHSSSENDALQKRINYFKRSKESALRCIDSFKKVQADMEKSKRLAVIAEKVASILTVLSFVSFFIILTFEPIASHLTKNQDVLTVLAFGTVLWSQYLREKLKGQQNKAKASYEAINDGWKILQEGLEREVKTDAD